MKVFEDFGFERRHIKTDIEGGENTNYNMKGANGNRINIASSEHVPQDLTSITMNVDNFQEAYDFLIARGFVNRKKRASKSRHFVRQILDHISTKAAQS